ncbi:MAG: PIN domain-containing protein [Candidatus Latescibacteria bacterium]|nr:PIN domain-containing protein [Candidatus Latescibacterota bacterium]
MTLTDTGPLVALVNKNDPNHTRCVAATKHLSAEPLVTTWPCFTEAMYLLFQAGGYPAQAELWRWWTAGRLVLHDLTGGEMDRMAALMDKYRDRPMDLADASLVAAVELLGLRSVFTLDSDFHIYRMADGSALDCVP